MSLTEEERFARLHLIRTDNVGPVTFQSLIERFGSATEALLHVGELSRKGGSKKPISPAPMGRIEKEWEDTHRFGAKFKIIGDTDYPALLRAVDPAPPVFAYLGHSHLFQDRSVAMVGARNASANSKKIAMAMAADIGAANYVIVSGLARGIDAASHQGALATGTVAVLAGGVDAVYPKENEALYKAIKEQGAIVSEMPLGHIGRAKDFPRRNRIISGLSLATVVVEAALRSGSLITARNALEQSREVFAVPGSPLDPRCRGANRLIKDGACLVEEGSDVISLLETFVPRILKDPNMSAPSDFGTTPSAPKEVELDQWREQILGLLGPSPTELDEIVRQSECPPGVVSTIILELDLAGRIEPHPGQKVALIDP